MCGVCLAAAIFMATQVSWAEKYLRETYALDDLPEEVTAVIAEAEKGNIERVEYLKLDDDGRRQLYEDWMNRPNDPPVATARALITVDAEFFLRRAQQSVVCGNAEQRARALEFLKIAPSDKSLEAVEKLLHWAQHRNLPELAKSINATLDHLKSRSGSIIKDGSS